MRNSICFKMLYELTHGVFRQIGLPALQLRPSFRRAVSKQDFHIRHSSFKTV